MKLGDALHSVYNASPVRQHMKALAWKRSVKDFAKKVKARQHQSPQAQKRPVNAPDAEEYEYTEDGDGEGALDGHRMAPTRLHLPGRSISRGGVCVSVASPGTDTGSWVEAIRLLKDAQDRNDPVEWCRFPNHIVL